ncbi:MAG: hypothetical protein JXA92_07855 [candidate division Zixibacteria bacterium]|nr:hypothetical protein [candidate division Zixibacteria bacterium]
MKLLLYVIAAILLILIIFTAANWSVLNTNTVLSFVFFDFEGPLGVILLVIILALVLLLVAYALLLRTTWLVESRRLNRQLEDQRVLAQQAETSRITALQELIGKEFKEMRDSLEASGKSGIARTESAEKALAKNIDDAANSIMAHIGYLDDKLRGGAQPSGS